jgi:hypothetical protein
MGDTARTEKEKEWLQGYVESAGLPKEIGFDNAIRDLIQKRKAARLA